MTDNVAQLAAQLASSNASQQLAAAERLAQLAEQARPAAVPLVNACAAADEEVREWSVAALEGLGPPPLESLEELTRLARHDNQEVAYWAVTLLGRLAGRGAPAAPVLGECLQASPHASVRERAAWALGKLGPAAADQRSALQQAAEGENPRLARLAQQALESLSG